jgi:hypothetical protein
MHHTTQNLKENSDGKYTKIRRIEVRYSDGRVVRYAPEGRREFFGTDDSAQLVSIFTAASSKIERASLREYYVS